jgi:hypothetical protein
VPDAKKGRKTEVLRPSMRGIYTVVTYGVTSIRYAAESRSLAVSNQRRFVRHFGPVGRSCRAHTANNSALIESRVDEVDAARCPITPREV